MHVFCFFWLLCGLLSVAPALAQSEGAAEAPPPGGWPLRRVKTLAPAPEPPGGLVPYRKGKRWGYADTTGRVWIAPVFRRDPGRNAFSGGVFRFGEWYLTGKQPDEHRRDFLSEDRYVCNARGEMLRSPWRRPCEFVMRPDSSLVAISPPVANGLLHRYAAEPVLLLQFERSDETRKPLAALPFYIGRQISRLRPTEMQWLPGRCGVRYHERVTRYKYDDQVALFDKRGRRLTDFIFHELWAAGPNCLIYSTVASDKAAWGDRYAAIRNAGLPRHWVLNVGQRESCFGLLDRAGHPRTEPRYTRLLQVGPNTVWAAAVERDTLMYGLLDTLGCVVLPFAAGPLSLPDSAGLMRRRSAAPLTNQDYNIWDETDRTRYPDSTTTSYYCLDGQLAFAGRFVEPGAFWRGRAMVRRGTEYGCIDLNGRWLLPLTEVDHQIIKRNLALRQLEDAVDPLRLF